MFAVDNGAVAVAAANAADADALRVTGAGKPSFEKQSVVTAIVSEY